MESVTNYITLLQQTIDQLPKEKIARVIDLLHSVRFSGRQVFIMGNGGSASTACMIDSVRSGGRFKRRCPSADAGDFLDPAEIDVNGIEPVIERVDEAAGADARQQRRRRRADHLRLPHGAGQPFEQL